MDFVTVSTGLILPYWMGLPIRYIHWRKKEMKLKKENIIQNDRTGRYANYKLVKK